MLGVGAVVVNKAHKLTQFDGGIPGRILVFLLLLVFGLAVMVAGQLPACKTSRQPERVSRDTAMLKIK